MKLHEQQIIFTVSGRGKVYVELIHISREHNGIWVNDKD